MFVDEITRRSISNMIDSGKEVDGNRKLQQYVTQKERLVVSMDESETEAINDKSNKKEKRIEGRKSVY